MRPLLSVPHFSDVYKRQGKSYIEHQAAQNGTSYKAKLKAAIDRLLPACSDLEAVSYTHLLYPSANILVTTKKDFETHNRKKFCARIATGDYDAIIMGHSQFERIPISRERQERLLYEQIDEITEGIAELQALSLIHIYANTALVGVPTLSPVQHTAAKSTTGRDFIIKSRTARTSTSLGKRCPSGSPA